MYKVRNTSLDSVFKEYSVTRLEDLDSEKLKEICQKRGTESRWKLAPIKNKTTNRISGYRKAEFDKFGTIDRLIGENSISIYMGDSYWQERHLELDQELELKEKLSKMMDGNEVMKLMDRVGFGVFNLKPGDEKEVDWTDEWIEDVLKKHPIYNKLYVTKVTPEKEVEGEVEKVEEQTEKKVETILMGTESKMVIPPKLEVDKEKGSDLEFLDYNALRSIAKNYGLKMFGVSKEELVKQIQEKIKKTKV
jgi:hypothetical protein